MLIVGLYPFHIPGGLLEALPLLLQVPPASRGNRVARPLGSPCEQGEPKGGRHQLLFFVNSGSVIGITGEQSVHELLREHQKDPDSPLAIQQLQIHDDTSEHYTVVDIQTEPDAGALYRAAARLAQLGWNIHSARLGQWAGRTLLSFYCTDTEGRKIPPEQHQNFYHSVQTLRVVENPAVERE